MKEKFKIKSQMAKAFLFLNQVRPISVILLKDAFTVRELIFLMYFIKLKIIEWGKIRRRILIK